MNQLTSWIFAKILTHLTNHEGITELETIRTSDQLRSTIQDALGFRYEVQIKCLGRIQTSDKEIL